MNGIEQTDIEELELYLQKTQEELLSSFRVDDRVVEHEPGGSRVSTNDAAGSPPVSYDTEEEAFNDILKFYDNVEFFKEHNQKCIRNSPSHIKVEPRKVTDDKNNNYDANESESIESCELICKTSVTEFEKPEKIRDTKSHRKGIRTCKNSFSEETNNYTLEEYPNHNRTVAETNLQVPLTCEAVNNSSQGSQDYSETGHTNYMDNLHNCKSWTVSCIRSANSGNLCTRPSSSKHCQEVSAHLELPGNHHIPGSLIEVSQENFSSFTETDMQSDGKEPSYLPGDNCQLDNEKSDREIESGALMSLQSRELSMLKNGGDLCNKLEKLTHNGGDYESGGIVVDGKCDKMKSLDQSDVSKEGNAIFGDTLYSDNGNNASINKSVIGQVIKDDLEEFLEEINESIDELISESKNEMSGSKSETTNSGMSCISASESKDGAVSYNTRSSMSDSGVSFISRSDISESCVSYNSIDSGCNNFNHSNFDQIRESVDRNNGIQKEEMKVFKETTNDTEVEIEGNGHDVVETDAGFYWLTSSIEEEGSTVNTKRNCPDEKQTSDLVDESVITCVGDETVITCVGDETVITNVGDETVITHVSDETVMMSSDRSLLEDDNKVVIINEETPVCQFSGISCHHTEEIINGDIIVDCKMDDGRMEKGRKIEGIDGVQTRNENKFEKCSEINGNKKKDVNKNLLYLPKESCDIMTTSAPDILSSDKSKVSKDDITLERGDEIRNLLKRKYSCPPNMFKIFKVVSVDIPKIDTSRISSSHENLKRSSFKSFDKRHSKHSISQPEGNSKRHSFEALLAKKKGEHDHTNVINDKLDTNGFKARYEPPAMFRDKPREHVSIAPILKPPADFDTDGPAVVMDTQYLPLPVWDPGVTPSIASATPDRKLNHTSTPPPPSVDHTEKLISKTLNQHIHRKHSTDANSSLGFLKPIETKMRKSGECGIRSEYIDLDLYQNSCSGTSSSMTDTANGIIAANEIETEDDQHIHKTDLDSDNSKMPHIISGNIKRVNRNKYEEDIRSKCKVNHDLSDVELAKMVDLLESYHASDNDNDPEKDHKDSAMPNKERTCHKHTYSCAAINNNNSLDRRKVKGFGNLEAYCDLSETEVDPRAIYASVDKSRPRKPTPEKVVPNSISVVPPPIPPRPKYLSEIFSRKYSPTKSDIDSHQNPDFQVMFNSLSPVLLRRNHSNRLHRKLASSKETSPDVSPSETRNNQNDFCNDKVTSGKKCPSESLFMEPEMAKTWHGATSTDWSQYYGPQMRAMMKKLNQLANNAGTNSSQDSVNKSAQSLDDAKSKTLPSKSLLDEMHKKFCADQYINEKDIEMTRALVLLRLKSQQPPAKPKRSQSFNIRMGTGASYSRHGPGASSSSASSESSPLFPRAAERLRIKTRPDVQYLPKPGQVRGVTPDPPRIEEPNNQAQISQKEEAEIEAIEACRWLRETGFPQYAQLYEDGQFPVDIESVEKDHDFLDKEDIQSLFRRLNTLNKCAIMKIGTPTKKESEESDEEDQCALSDKWKYQRSSRRWSRKDIDCPFTEKQNGQAVLKSASSHDSLLADQNSSSETGDSPVLDCKMLHTNEDMVFKTSTPMYDTNANTTLGVSPRVIRRAASERIKGAKSFLKRMESLKGKRGRKNKTITEISGPVIADNADMQAKIKHLNCRDINLPVDANANISEASKPIVNGEAEVKINASASSPELITSSRNEALTVVTFPGKLDNSNALNRTNSSTLNTTNSSDLNSGNTTAENSADLSQISTNGALGLDLSMRSQRSNSSETSNSSQETLFMPVEYRPGKFPTLLDDSLFTSDSNVRTRSFSYADEGSVQDTKRIRRGSHDPRKQFNRVSIYDNVPIEEDLATAQEELDIILSELFQNINGLNRAINGDNAELLEPPVPNNFLDVSSVSIDSQLPENQLSLDGTSDITPQDENEVISGTLSSSDISDHEIHVEDMSHDDSAEHIVVRERRDSGVGSSLTRTNSERRKYRIRWHSFQKSHRPTSEGRNLQLCNLSAGQILVLRKLSLLKLTALIEKYAPNRSGWSLTVPRFMKRHKVPDYKDKNVFGVPFSVMIQRTGQALPQCILHALRFLRRTAEDALGIFRKSGVRSRIQKLRNDIEADPEAVDFEDLQAFDVADLVKQYFRELPECLLTNKLSDIFISIFIYVPTDLRLEALQAAVVLMTDENRDVLQSLLLFLSDIAKQANKHQMTSSNLAVCFAPSLFNMGGPRNISQTPSPRRNRKNPGIPDARELMEQKAAHECLTVMINECKKLFTIPAATLSKCRVLHEDPVTLEELNKQSEDGNQGYTAHIDSCIQGLLKESREKFRGWVSVSAPTDVDVSYKKVGDGHPLRLWKCTVDVEAPPNEVLNRVLHDRQKWDEDLLQWNTVEKLDKQTEVFQFVRNSMAPHPTRDYCVLRSWRADLPKGACVLISTSIEHQDGELLGGIRGVVLASRYLIEPCGTGKSRLTHISRVDLRGHSPEWYKKVYGHICANFVDRIRASFRCNSEGPETKV